MPWILTCFILWSFFGLSGSFNFIKKILINRRVACDIAVNQILTCDVVLCAAPWCWFDISSQILELDQLTAVRATLTALLLDFVTLYFHHPRTPSPPTFLWMLVLVYVSGGDTLFSGDFSLNYWPFGRHFKNNNNSNNNKTTQHKIETRKRLKSGTLFIRTKHNMRIFGVIPFFNLQNNT